MSVLAELPTEDGQLDDAPVDQPTLSVDNATPVNPREGNNFIDEERLLEWSESSEDEEDEYEVEENDMEVEAYETLRAEDEDWERTERDFTKQYNRLRQHVAIRTGAAGGVLQSNTSNRSAVASVPAINRPRQAKTAPTDAKTQQPSKDKTENQLQALSKYSSRLRNLDTPYELGVGVNRKGPSASANQKDKSDRATNEQVLDPRTRIILFKMIGRGLLFEVNGCVSTGKEANVYHALTSERRHLALKIYKTSILVFKDRDRYVSGEYRFRKGYRQVLKFCHPGYFMSWTQAVTILVKWASPRLKDAQVPASVIADLYAELILMVRKMFQECKLVHADLSEYNILYHIESPPSLPTSTSDDSSPAIDATPSTEPNGTEPPAEPRGHLYIIDVSQSVEQDHPHAFDFLRSDLKNVEDFFSKRGMRCLGLRRSFEFVTAPDLGGEGSVEDALRRWLEEDVNDEENDGTGAEGTSSANHEDEVFMRSYIPRTLNEVFDPERDVSALGRGEGETLIYKDTIGIIVPKAKEGHDEKSAPNKVRFEGDSREAEVSEDSEDDEDGEESDSDSDGDEDGEYKDRKPRGHRHEDKDAKKERKKVAKEEAREKRKHKLPKAEKKRKIKTSSRGGK
ncbi:hypothetical protein EUX98_g7147 [Antrodiella citrinella]|uniref:Serine/threonine-protein kinase RIO1 n=1 Tax=Antrodiella citrinella TaxID=2447956 RepID=A0A4S4MPQ1_9APHY|nr:hypothetical protein EUX98_g7147 [Antrodiella citrinella]